MFISYEVKDHIPKENRYLIRILDSDFIEDVSVMHDEFGMNLPSSILSLYSKRKLNVAFNLIKYFEYISKRFNMDMNEVMSNVYGANPDIKVFKEDIEKYLILK